jgi:hypothetical protein
MELSSGSQIQVTAVHLHAVHRPRFRQFSREPISEGTSEPSFRYLVSPVQILPSSTVIQILSFWIQGDAVHMNLRHLPRFITQFLPLMLSTTPGSALVEGWSANA